MKLENKEFTFDSFRQEMTKLKQEKHFDYLVTIVGEDSGRRRPWMYFDSRKSTVYPNETLVGKAACKESG